LKKQSQFAAAHVGANSLEKGDYDNMPTGDADENKAKQTQSKPHADIWHKALNTPGGIPGIKY
jgi:hypothetical protein